MPSPGDNSNRISDTVPILTADTNGIVVSVDSAYAIAMALPTGGKTAEQYKITAYINSIITNLDDVPRKYANVNMTIKDDGKQALTCQYTNYINNYPFRSKTQVPAVGSKITVVGILSKYTNGSPQMLNGYIMRVDSAAVAE